MRCLFAFSLVILLNSAGILVGLGQSPATVSEFAGAPFSSTAAELSAASAVMPPNREYDAQILFEEGTYQFAADGTLAFQQRTIYRLDSANSVKNWAEISSAWDPWYEKQAQLHARVLEPNGTFVELDQKTITDAPVNAEEDDTYSSEHVRRAPLPGLAIGAIIEELHTVEEKIPYFSGGEAYRYSFRDNVPVGRIRMIVDLPSSMPFKDIVPAIAGLAVNRSEADGRRHAVYEAAGIAARHGSDINLETNEPDVQLVEFGTGASWAQVVSAYAALADPQIVTADVEPILPVDLPTDRMARIRAIVHRLHEQVRYTGVEFGAARLTPQRPSAVIERHYGDCKDKATLLVAMLRAAGIPANLALLSAGPGLDVKAELPGMNHFNHAIVYVPPSSGKSDKLWIDATAEFYEVGTLPYEDRARMALVVAPETKGLIRTPEPRPEDSTLTEARTFTLAEMGAAHVVESSETHGYIDANYRANYGGPDTPKMHEELENYIQNAYLAKTLTAVTHGGGTDFEHPFELTLVADGARRGYTSMDEAVVALFPNGAAEGLPKWFFQTPPVIGKDTSDDVRHDLQEAAKSRLATYAIRPFVNEKSTRVLVPEGFQVRSLPADKVTQLGAAKLTEKYDASEPGVVKTTFRFESGPANITAEQAVAMRTAVLELSKRDWVGLYFDQVGAKALVAGHIREALEADRGLIAARPTEALHHVRLARALLEAGIGTEAQEEAKKATELDPKSAQAFSTLGWTLQHNGLGVRFGKGFDRAAAVAAYQKAVALDPEDNDIRFDQSILCEFDAHGIRYTKDSDLAAAIAGYKDLIERTKDKDPQNANQYRENLIYGLLFSRQFAELDKTLAALPSSNAHTTVAITSAAAQHGAPAGIAQADKGNVSASDRNKDLRAAGLQLASLRLYAEAADVASAGIEGGEDAPTVARQIEFYRSLRSSNLTQLPATNPANPAQKITFGVMAGTLTHDEVVAALSHHAYATPEALERDVKKTLASSGFLRGLAEKSDYTEPVLLDLLAGNMTFTSTGDDATGYAVVATSPGENPSHYYVVREDGMYRVVADGNDNEQLGNEILYALGRGNAAQAKAMLNWKRDMTHRESGDDPFEGPLLPRFWTIGSSKPGADSPAAMRLAAISLLTGSMEAKNYLAEVSAEREKASGQRQTDLDLLLARAGVGAEDPEVALPAAKRLLEEEPDSLTALEMAGQSYAFKNDAADWVAMLKPLLEKKPKDHDLLSEQERAYTTAGDFAAAQTAAQKVLDSGKANSSDYNSYAWLGLFHGQIGEDITKAAQQSNMLTKNGSFAELHTLACIYAAQGRTTEARQVLDQAMHAANMTQPDSSVWYALGLIYEQYGAKTAALDAYGKVEAHEFDDHTYMDPLSTWVLAQQRIKSWGR